MPNTKPETATVKLTSPEQAVADAVVARIRREWKRECIKTVGIPAMILVCFVAYFSHYIPGQPPLLKGRGLRKQALVD